MKDKKFEDFWLEKSKEEIINAYRECIHNGEVLLKRIDKAIEIIETLKNDNSSYYDETIINNTIRDLLDILKGSDNYE